MAPPTSTYPLLSPAELSYLHTSLSLHPPIRPDARSATQFRPLVAETDILPGTNGSARICFADGTEAIVGVKAEVEKSDGGGGGGGWGADGGQDDDEDEEQDAGRKVDDARPTGTGQQHAWVEVSLDMPGFREDDALPVFLAAMLNEALLASGDLPGRLWINRRFHWRLYIDILLLSPPLSYPLPLLSLTSHLALLSTRLPRLTSEGDEDPSFHDDWEASTYLYPRHTSTSTAAAAAPTAARPPITLLVIAVGTNIIFDPTKEELSVADLVLAVSVTSSHGQGLARRISLLSIRTVDPPARLTPSGVPDALNPATTAGAGASAPLTTTTTPTTDPSLKDTKHEGVWIPPRGGVKRALVMQMIKLIVQTGGVAQEVLDGLEAVHIG